MPRLDSVPNSSPLPGGRRPRFLAAVLAAGALVFTAGCGSDQRIHAFGAVADEVDVITVPALPVPAVADVLGTPGPLAGSLASDQLGSAPFAEPTGTPSPEPTRTPLPQQPAPERPFGQVGSPQGGAAGQGAGLPAYVRITAVEVSVGDEVTAGQVLARLDDRALAATTAGTKAEAAAAAAQPGVVGARIDEVAERETEARDKRAEVQDTLADLRERRTEVRNTLADLRGTRSDVQSTLADLRSTRSDVTSTLGDLRSRRRVLAGQLAQARDLASRMRNAPPVIPPQGAGAPGAAPPGGVPAALPPGVPSPQELQANIARMEAGIGQLDQGIREAESGLGRIDSGIREANSGLARIDDGIRRATDGLAQIDDGIETAKDAIATLDDVLEALAQGKRTLEGMKKVAEAAVPVTQTAVQVAEHRQSLAVVTAPAAGRVVEVVDAGSTLPTGAPLARLRPASSTARPVVTTWLAPDVAAQVCPGGTATVGGDWAASATAARVSYVAPTAEYPPSEVATDQVHLLRAVRVDVTAEGSLPAGAPADVLFDPCEPGTDPTPFSPTDSGTASDGATISTNRTAPTASPPAP